MAWEWGSGSLTPKYLTCTQQGSKGGRVETCMGRWGAREASEGACSGRFDEADGGRGRVPSDTSDASDTSKTPWTDGQARA